MSFRPIGAGKDLIINPGDDGPECQFNLIRAFRFDRQFYWERKYLFLTREEKYRREPKSLAALRINL